MNIVGFIISVLGVIIIFLNRNKMAHKQIKRSVLLILISIPLYIMILFILKSIDIKPNKHLTLSIYISFMSVMLFTITIIITQLFLSKLINFQIKIGNKNHSLIKKIITNKLKIINTINYIQVIGFCYIIYVVWFIQK